ncbi:MAG: RidA family protein [Desulfobacterales bacterium]|nr:RidA family protein [Desulfobacterales bacterium]
MQKRYFYLRGHPFVFLSTTGHGAKGATEEATLACSRLDQEMRTLGGSIDDVVRTTVFTRNQECRPAISEIRGKAFVPATRPASSSIIVKDFTPGDTLIEIDSTAILSRGQKYRKKGIEFNPARAYLKALLVEDLVFVSGQGGRGENIEVQTQTACRGINEILVELGTSWDKVLLLSCYVKKQEWFDMVCQLLREKTGNPSLWIDLAVADGYARPEMLIEIEATAYK